MFGGCSKVILEGKARGVVAGTLKGVLWAMQLKSDHQAGDVAVVRASVY